MATLDYIRNTIYSKEEARNIINQIINTTETKIEQTIPATDKLKEHESEIVNLTSPTYLDTKLQSILPVPRHTRRIIREAIQCPTNVYETAPINDGQTLDDYLNREVCQNYIQSFEESYL